jgi:hypothetical protein
VVQEELDLLEFAARQVSQPRACAAKVVRRQLVDAGAGRRHPDNIPQYLRRHSVAPDPPGLVDGAEYSSLRDGARCRPRIDRGLDPLRDGYCPDVTALPTRSAITQCSSRCWIDSIVSASNSSRRKPQPISIASMAWSRASRGGVAGRGCSSRAAKRSYRAPRRQAQADQTRRAILGAAHEQFLAHGYDATSIRAIAREAKASEQTVYNAFGDKPSLLVAVGLRVVSGGARAGVV